MKCRTEAKSRANLFDYLPEFGCRFSCFFEKMSRPSTVTSTSPAPFYQNYTLDIFAVFVNQFSRPHWRHVVHNFIPDNIVSLFSCDLLLRIYFVLRIA